MTFTVNACEIELTLKTKLSHLIPGQGRVFRDARGTGGPGQLEEEPLLQWGPGERACPGHMRGGAHRQWSAGRGLGGAGVAEAHPLVLSAVDAALAHCKMFLNQIELEEKGGFNVK